MVRTDSKAEIQHYVPKVLLRSFAREKHPDQVFVFDKLQARVFPTNIKNVLAERGFYDVGTGDKKISLEPVLTEIENDFSGVHRKLLAERSLKSLTARERECIANFAATQFMRVKSMRESQGHIDNLISEKISQSGGDINNIKGWRPFASQQDLDFFSMSMVAKLVPEFSCKFADKVWALMETNVSNPFMIGDNPITLHNDQISELRGNLGIGVDGIQIHFPLSATLMIAMWCPTLWEEMQIGLAEIRRKKEELRVSRLLHLGGNYEEQTRRMTQLDKVERDLRRNNEAIISGKPLVCAAENVMFFNSLQVVHAERYLVSAKNDFSLAQEMIASDERIRTGKRMSIS